MVSKKNRYCYVCGFDFDKDKDKEVKFGATCPCCVFEYGIDDTVYGINFFMEYRMEWINEGLPFKKELRNDAEWNLERALMQLENLQHVKLEDYFLKTARAENDLWTSEVDREYIKNRWNECHLPDEGGIK